MRKSSSKQQKFSRLNREKPTPIPPLDPVIEPVRDEDLTISLISRKHISPLAFRKSLEQLCGGKDRMNEIQRQLVNNSTFLYKMECNLVDRIQASENGGTLSDQKQVMSVMSLKRQILKQLESRVSSSPSTQVENPYKDLTMEEVDEEDRKLDEEMFEKLKVMHPRSRNLFLEKMAEEEEVDLNGLGSQRELAVLIGGDKTLSDKMRERLAGE